MNLKTPIATVLLLFAAASAASAQDVWMKINEGAPAISFALPKFAATPAAQAAADEIYAVLEADVQFTRIFQLLPKSYYGYIRPLLEAKAPVFKDWESIQTNILFAGTVSESAPGETVFEWYLHDVKSQRLIVGKRYQAKKPDLRYLAHRTADEILKAYGEKPLFTTKIAFVSARDGNDEIYLMDYDGGNPTRLTYNAVTDYTPSISPDGKRLAYTSFLKMIPGLYVLDIFEGKRTTVTQKGQSFAPAWSPDGKRLAFSSSMDGNAEVYAAEVEAGPTRLGRIKRLTFSPGVDTAPTWSPNGREIAFTSDRGGTPQIYIMDAEGGNPRRISFGANYHDSPAWSPNGDKIVYVARVENVFDLYVYNVRSGQISKLTESNARNESPTWSPDGRHIVFTSNKDGTAQIYCLDADGQNLRKLTARGGNKLPDWSN
jgi:TolB protein